MAEGEDIKFFPGRLVSSHPVDIQTEAASLLTDLERFRDPPKLTRLVLPPDLIKKACLEFEDALRDPTAKANCIHQCVKQLKADKLPLLRNATPETSKEFFLKHCREDMIPSENDSSKYLRKLSDSGLSLCSTSMYEQHKIELKKQCFPRPKRSLLQFVQIISDALGVPGTAVALDDTTLYVAADTTWEPNTSMNPDDPLLFLRNEQSLFRDFGAMLENKFGRECPVAGLFDPSRYQNLAPATVVPLQRDSSINMHKIFQVVEHVVETVFAASTHLRQDAVSPIEAVQILCEVLRLFRGKEFSENSDDMFFNSPNTLTLINEMNKVAAPVIVLRAAAKRIDHFEAQAVIDAREAATEKVRSSRPANLSDGDSQKDLLASEDRRIKALTENDATVVGLQKLRLRLLGEADDYLLNLGDKLRSSAAWFKLSQKLLDKIQPLQVLLRFVLEIIVIDDGTFLGLSPYSLHSEVLISIATSGTKLESIVTSGCCCLGCALWFYGGISRGHRPSSLPPATDMIPHEEQWKLENYRKGGKQPPGAPGRFGLAAPDWEDLRQHCNFSNSWLFAPSAPRRDV